MAIVNPPDSDRAYNIVGGHLDQGDDRYTLMDKSTTLGSASVEVSPRFKQMLELALT